MTSDEDYPLNAVLKRSKATDKPHELVKCRRCPNADWVEEFTETEYGADMTLRAFCSGLGGQWIWPQRNVGSCSARLRAIRAERGEDGKP